MNKKTRYSILAFGFIFFLVAAPVTVLYVRGITYDFAAKSFVKTGLLAVRTTPGDAQIFLNGKLNLRGQGDIRFLLPAEYDVAVKKAGYGGWDKRLTVSEGQVTWANPAGGSIYLFLQNPPVKNLASGVSDFYSQGKNLLFLTANNLAVTTTDNPSKEQDYPLPKNADKILAADDSGQNFVLGGESASGSGETLLIFNISSGQFSDIGSLLPSTSKMRFGPDGSLYALSAGTLYKVKAADKIKTPVFTGVETFTFQDGQLYFMAENNGSSALFESSQPFSDRQLILSGLPDAPNADLYVTFEKEVLLLFGGNLYLASSNMQALAGNVSTVGFNRQNSLLTVLHSGELDYYDPLAHNLNFVTRSSQALSNPVVNTGIGWSFFAQGNNLTAIELDARDKQNQSVLYQGQNIKNFYADDAGKNILLLDNGQLKSMVIR